MILTQRDLCVWLREAKGLRCSPSSIKHCVNAGMPVVRLPWLKKDRFDTDQVYPWMVSTREVNPLALAIRDKIFKKSRRTAA